MSPAWRCLLALLAWSASVPAQSYTAPAGLRPAQRHRGASILPGGRVIAPLGDQYVTGPRPRGLAVSPSGRTVITANGGPWRNSLTILERERTGWQVRQFLTSRGAAATDAGHPEGGDWRGVFMGLAFAGEHAVFASEGNSGKISLFDWNSERRRVIDLDQNGFQDSFTGDLALDAERNVLYAIDQANFRVAVIETRSRQVIASVRVGRLPFALALSPDRRTLYVTNPGMFEYQPIPGADPNEARASGLPFPAFGFPSAEAAAGAERQTAQGTVRVPGLGDPNARESNSLCVVDVSDPGTPKVRAFLRTGVPFGVNSSGGSSPSGVIATAERVFVSNAGNDSITMIDAKTDRIEAEIPIRIPGLEPLRGVLPSGMAFHPRTGWLLVAEAGINAVGVIDPRARRVLGHLPAAWFPTRVAIDRDTVLVANARGTGTGPNAILSGPVPAALPPGQVHQGSVSIFPLPRPDELQVQSAFVMEANGFRPGPRVVAAKRWPGIRHVVLIVKESRTYDEVLGDVAEASNGPAMGAPELARFGSVGYVPGRGRRLSLHDVNVTPNQHAIARQWSLSDNFYADSDLRVDGHHWLAGAYPNAWVETSLGSAYGEKKEFRPGSAPGRLASAGLASSVHPEGLPEGGAIWHHLARNGVSFYSFGEGFELAGVVEGPGLEPTGARFLTNIPMPEPLYRNTSRQYPGFNMNIPDQYRASQLIREIEEEYVRKGAELPQFIFIHLPNDHMADARPDDGYPYEESFVADNDYALGRILEYLSGTKWWNEMVVFITEVSAEGGVDHIDAHRTLLLCAGPWAKRGYVSHTNASFPGLIKTIFHLLGLPPLNLFDAAAADLSDCLASEPAAFPYRAVDVDKRIFDSSAARTSRDGISSPRMMGNPRRLRP